MTCGRHDRGSLLLQVAIATTAATGALAAVAATAVPTIHAARTWSCETSRRAVETAAVAHMAASGEPARSLHDLADGDAPELVLPLDATIGADGRTLTLPGWTLTIELSGGAPSASCDVER